MYFWQFSGDVENFEKNFDLRMTIFFVLICFFRIPHIQIHHSAGDLQKLQELINDSEDIENKYDANHIDSM